MLLNPLIQGFLIGASLIIAIGPQNAFVISQGIKQEHVLLCTSLSACCDVVLISLGIFGFGDIFSHHPLLITLARCFGGLFLFAYGLLSLRSAFKPKTLLDSDLKPAIASKKKITLLLLALAFLNPHAYLDTVVLLGSISVKFAGHARYVFGFGAIIASIVWFTVIGFGARFLAPLFKKQTAWRVLDVIITLIMWGIAGSLLYPLLSML